MNDQAVSPRIAAESARISEALRHIQYQSTTGAYSAMFSELAEIRQSLIRLEVGMFEQAQTAHTWAVIGHWLGVSKQAAFKRYRRSLRLAE